MVVYKLKKSGQMIYSSHHDMMRLFLISLKRAGVSILANKSGEPKVYFSPATNIGINSKAEFVEIETNMTAHKLAEELKTYLPEGLEIISEYDTKNRLSISKIAILAKYEIEIENIDGLQKKISEFLQNENSKIVQKMNGVIRETFVKPSIHNFYFEKGKLYILSKIGEENLNISALMSEIYSKLKISDYSLEITKTNIFARVDERYHDIELVVLRNSN